MTKKATEENKIISIEEHLRSLTLEQFIWAYVNIWDPARFEFNPLILWPDQIEMCKYLDNSKVVFFPKARQVGGSVLASAKIVKTAIEEPNALILIVSKDEKAAIKLLTNKLKPILENLPRGYEGLYWPTYIDQKQSIQFPNGSTIESLTTSDDAGRGDSTRLVVIDEASVVEHARKVWKSAKPTLEKNPRGQIIVISNSNHGSWFNTMMKRIRDGLTKGIDMFFLSVFSDPNRTEAWVNQEITNYDSEVDFYNEYPRTIDDMLMKREGAVFPSFDPKEGGKHVNRFETDFSMRIGCLYDDGYQHPAAYILFAYEPFSNHLYVFDEVFLTQAETVTIAQEIIKKNHEWKEKGWVGTFWKKIADSAIFAQRGQQTVGAILRQYTGISFTKSIKHDMLGSLRMLQDRIKNCKLTIHPRCHNSIRQLTDLCWAKDPKDTKDERPVDREDEISDLLRYLEAELRQEFKPLPTPDPKPYNAKLNAFRKNNHILGGLSPEIKSQRSLHNWQKHC